MNDRTVLFTANAGFIVSANGITLAVDAFPRIADRGFSALPAEHFQQLCQNPDLADVRYVIATHDHKDHYSKQWNEQFLSCHPQTRFIGAVEDGRTPNTMSTQLERSLTHFPILLQSDHPTYYLPGITLEFLRLPHEGAEFANVDNYGCLATFTGNGSRKACRILFLGDAKPADPAIADWIAGRSVDLALLNFPWVALPKGRDFIEKYLSGAHIGVIHLPYEKDDRNHYVAATKRAATHFDAFSVTLFTAFEQMLSF